MYIRVSPSPWHPLGIGMWGQSPIASFPSTRESLLSSSENGTGGREMPPADSKSQGHWLGGRGSRGNQAGSKHPSLSAYAARTERILSDLLPFCRPGPEGQLAATALQKGRPALHPPGPGAGQTVPLFELEEGSVFQISLSANPETLPCPHHPGWPMSLVLQLLSHPGC